LKRPPDDGVIRNKIGLRQVVLSMDKTRIPASWFVVD